MDGIPEQEEGEPQRGHHSPPASRAQLRAEDPGEQDQEERDPDQEVAEVDHGGAQQREDRCRGEDDRDQPEHPEIVALAREAREPEPEEADRERGVEGCEFGAHGEPERESEGARDDLAGHGRGAAADREVAQVDDREDQEPEGRRRVQAERIGDGARARTGAPREAQRRQSERTAPEEDEEELREDPEAGGGGEARGRPAPAALEEAQQREERGQCEEHGERIAARLRRVVDEREARGADSRGEHGFEASSPCAEERREHEGPRAREERRQAVDRPLALVSEPVEEEGVEVVVVRVVDLREDAECGREPVRVRPGPDLVQPEVVPAGDRAHDGPGQDAGGDREPRRTGAHRRFPQISTRGACTAVRKRCCRGSSRFSKAVSG